MFWASEKPKNLQSTKRPGPEGDEGPRDSSPFPEALAGCPGGGLNWTGRTGRALLVGSSFTRLASCSGYLSSTRRYCTNWWWWTVVAGAQLVRWWRAAQMSQGALHLRRH